MLTGAKKIAARFGGPICRRCINAQYGVSLKPFDCKYPYPYKDTCPRCGEMQNIVDGFRISGKIKMLFARDTDPGNGENG